MSAQLFTFLLFWSLAGGLSFVIFDIYDFDKDVTYLQRLFIVALCGPVTLAIWLFCFGIVGLFDALGNKK